MGVSRLPHVVELIIIVHRLSEARWDLSSPRATTNADYDVRRSGRFTKRYIAR